MTPQEEHMDLTDFPPVRGNLLLEGVYGDYPHNNDWSHLEKGVLEEAAWKRPWQCLASQMASWYAMPSGSLGCWFMAILDTEWQGVLDRIWNY